MKRRLAGMLLAGLALACLSCMLETPAQRAEAEQEEARISAKVAAVIDLVGQAKITGDRTALDQYLAAEDPEGGLAAIVDAALAGQPAAKSLDEWGLDDYVAAMAEIFPHLADGDVLLFAGDAVITADLLNLVFVNAYSHAGIVSQAVPFLPETTQVLSATVTNADGSGFLVGVRYQSLEELYLATDTWARVRHLDPPQGNWAGSFYSDFNESNTVYGFLDLCLNPISREDERFWYCSKVPWRSS